MKDWGMELARLCSLSKEVVHLLTVVSGGRVFQFLDKMTMVTEIPMSVRRGMPEDVNRSGLTTRSSRTGRQPC